MKPWATGLALCVLAASACAWDLAAGDWESVRLEYRVRIDLDQAAGKARVWLPIPSSGPYQEVGELSIHSPWEAKVLREGEYGNRYLFTESPAAASGSVEIAVSFRVCRSPVHAGKWLDKDASGLERLLGPDSLVPLQGTVLRESREVSSNAGADDLPRVLYDHVVDSMRYDKSREGWGRGDALRACDLRSGNCTDFHSLFIGLARVQKIPARFIMGAAIPRELQGEIPGYHCWAEFWKEGEGWVPVDASEASKDQAKRDFYFGRLDARRVEFSRGRDLLLEPAPSSGRLNYFYHPLVEVGGRVHHGVSSKIAFIRG